MKTTKALATVTAAAAAVAGLSLAVAPGANAATDATKTVTKSFTQTCQTVGPLGQRSFPSTITVTLPTSVAHGASFTTTTKIKLTVPGSVNGAAYALGARSQQTTLQTINVNTTKLSKATWDITGAGVTTAPKTNVPNGTPTTLTFPLIHTTFKAGATAGTANIKTGSIAGFFNLYAADGSNPFGQQQLSCAAQNVLVTTLPVT